MTFETALAGIEMSGSQKMCLFTLRFISIKLYGQSIVLYKPLLQLIQGGVTACGLETLAKLLWVHAFCILAGFVIFLQLQNTKWVSVIF